MWNSAHRIRRAAAIAALLFAATSGTSQHVGPQGVSTIRYDPGGAGYWNLGIPGPIVGNLFDTQLGSPLGSGTIYWVSANAFGDYGIGDLFVAGPILGSTAAYIARIDLRGSPTGGYSASFSPITVPASFLIGFRANLANGLWVASGTYLGQGVHGRYWNGGYNGLPATGIREMPGATYLPQGLNAAIRARGNVAAVPVELMEFDID